MQTNSRNVAAFTLKSNCWSSLPSLPFWPVFSSPDSRGRERGEADPGKKRSQPDRHRGECVLHRKCGKYPLVTADTIYGPGGTANNVLFNELRATSATQNPRQIVFISPPDAKDQTNSRSGIKTSDGQWYDPWGTPYNVEIDGNYDNSVANPYGPQSTGGAGSDPVRLGVITWSRGSDQTLGTNGDNVYKNPTTGAQSDDVISWQ
jgi:hypothetical protein